MDALGLAVGSGDPDGNGFFFYLFSLRVSLNRGFISAVGFLIIFLSAAGKGQHHRRDNEKYRDDPDD
ncbi:MAG: hypothetical protein IKI91_00575 [Clostridia bacterium]|nr:hypothetical protein [Clostridia bacterium]